jgi:adenylyltransferase/sulfurtransferase
MKIHIPTPLRAYTGQQETVTVTGTTVAAGLQGLVDAFPALRQHLFTPDNKLRSFVNIYVGDEDMRYLPEGEDTPIADAGEVTIIPSIAGGSSATPAPVARCCR